MVCSQKRKPYTVGLLFKRRKKVPFFGTVGLRFKLQTQKQKQTKILNNLHQVRGLRSFSPSRASAPLNVSYASVPDEARGGLQPRPASARHVHAQLLSTGSRLPTWSAARHARPQSRPSSKSGSNGATTTGRQPPPTSRQRYYYHDATKRQMNVYGREEPTLVYRSLRQREHTSSVPPSSPLETLRVDLIVVDKLNREISTTLRLIKVFT